VLSDDDESVEPLVTVAADVDDDVNGGTDGSLFWLLLKNPDMFPLLLVLSVFFPSCFNLYKCKTRNKKNEP
jgi:hypothetical protein